MYFTFYKQGEHITQVCKQITCEDFLLDFQMPEELKIETFFKTGKNITIKKDKNEEVVRTYFEKHCYPAMYAIPEPPKYSPSELPKHYSSFKIPKKSGGLRQIDAPDEQLKHYLTQLKDYFEITLRILTHDTAHAYVKTRSTVSAIKVHQANKSKWFLKLDISNFFGSHTLDYVMKALENIYPTCYLLEDPTYAINLRNALQYAFLDGKLPQGTPLSPTLTNILMTPLDYEIQHKLWDLKNNYIYTRYADDMLISSKYSFDFKFIERNIKRILTEFNTPFKIKSEKTRYGSSAGSNWNLGIMLNKDNRMTIGHKENQRFRAMIHSIIMDYKNNIFWSVDDKAELSGKISYFKSIDPDYITATIQRYEQKYNVSLKVILKN